MNDFEQKQRWIASFVAALLFLIISSPTVYKLVSSIFSNLVPSLPIANGEGCPTMLGLVVHTIVFFLLVRAVMEIPMMKKTDDTPAA